MEKNREKVQNRKVVQSNEKVNSLGGQAVAEGGVASCTLAAGFLLLPVVGRQRKGRGRERGRY